MLSTALFGVVLGPWSAAIAIASGPEAGDATSETAARDADHAIRRDAGGTHHRATNLRQGYALRFDGRGFDVLADGAAAWGLELGSRTGVSVGSRDGAPIADGRHLRYRWSNGVDEWFVNHDRGLEHGFTVPNDLDAGAHLVLQLDVRGPLRAMLDGGDDAALVFVDDDGSAHVRYGGLVAFDANARPLDASFVLPADADGRQVHIVVDDRDALHPITVDPIIELVYLKAPNTDSGDQFGQSVALDGSIAVIGADLESSGATGVDGDQSDNGAGNAGAVHVVHRNGPSWGYDAYLKASNTDAFDRFGSSVDVSGTTVVVGARSERGGSTGIDGDDTDDSAPNSGAAYVFEGPGGQWAQSTYLKASNAEADDVFGFSVAIDDDTIVIGAPEEASGSTLAPFDPSDNGVPGAGAVYVFARSGSTWVEQAYLKASDAADSARFGWSVAVDGDQLVVGAPDAEVGGEARTGAAYVFTRTGDAWTERARLTASNGDTLDRFGHSVDVSGDTIVVGATGEQGGSAGVGGNGLDNSLSNAGAVYIFTGSGDVWSQEAYLKASNPGQSDEFGSSVAIDGEFLVVGAHREASSSSGIDSEQNDDSAFMTGAAYLFTRNSSTWSFDVYIKGPDTDIFDVFGTSVAIDGTTLLIGSAGEDGSGVGVTADPADDGASSAGAAFAFEVEYWRVLPGCFGNTAAFDEPTTPARVGTRIPLVVTTSSASNGVVAPYFGNLAADPSGCGVVLPGLGEVLLATAPFPKALPVVPLVGGAAALEFFVPDVPAFAGVVVTLQAFAVDTGTFAAEVSNAVILEVRP